MFKPRDFALAAALPAGALLDLSVTLQDMAADSVDASKIVDNSVGTAELAANSVTSAEIAANAVGAPEIAPNTITAAEIAANTITAAEIPANTVTAAELAANTVTATELSLFVSAEIAGTGGAQNTAHGLGGVPAAVFVTVNEGDNGAGAAGTQAPHITEGAHDGINCVVTAPTGSTYKVIAFG